MNDELKTQPVKCLKKMQQLVVDKLTLLANLNTEYRQKQQKHFMKIFLFIMDKMSTQLGQAQQMYQNIDSEIERDIKCLQLSTKLKFFKTQCLYLRQQLDKTESEIKAQKQKQKQLIQQKQSIQANLFQKSKQVYRYKTKVRNLSLQYGKQGIKTQTNQKSLKFINIQNQQQKRTKNVSFSQAKNTKFSSFSHFEKPSQSPTRLQSSQAEFRIKAARLAKQRKLMMSKSYYSNSNQKKINNKHQTLQILQ